MPRKEADDGPIEVFFNHGPVGNGGDTWWRDFFAMGVTHEIVKTQIRPNEEETRPLKRVTLADKITGNVDLIRLSPAVQEKIEFVIPNEGGKSTELENYLGGFVATYERPREGVASLTLGIGEARKTYTFDRVARVITRIEVQIGDKLPRTMECDESSYEELFSLTSLIKDAVTRDL